MLRWHAAQRADDRGDVGVEAGLGTGVICVASRSVRIARHALTPAALASDVASFASELRISVMKLPESSTTQYVDAVDELRLDEPSEMYVDGTKIPVLCTLARGHRCQHQDVEERVWWASPE